MVSMESWREFEGLVLEARGENGAVKFLAIFPLFFILLLMYVDKFLFWAPVLFPRPQA